VETLADVCQKRLDNADLDIEGDLNSGRIKLVFYESGKVVFECGRIFSLKIVRDYEDEPPYFVGETYVREVHGRTEVLSLLAQEGWKFPADIEVEKAYEICVYGGIEVRIVCLHFNWFLEAYDSGS